LTKNIGRIDSLDGIRAFSILLVLIGHALHGKVDIKEYLGDIGNLGVRIFFAISGFLITTLLLKELNSSGSISLKNFYIRRSLRIFPAYIFLLIVMLLLALLNFIEIEPYLFARAGTYTINYLPVKERGWYLGHLWSLAVEEQFYLLWPVIFLISGRKKASYIVVGVICVLPFVRYFSWLYFPESRALIKWAFHTVCDSIAAGCLLALVKDKLHSIDLYKRWLNSFMPLILPLIIFTINWYLVGRPRFNYLIAQSAMNIAIVLFIDYAVNVRPRLLFATLNNPLAVMIGTLSYSLYLWQQFFLIGDPEYGVQEFPVNIILTGIAAYISYHFIEKRFLNLKERFN